MSEELEKQESENRVLILLSDKKKHRESFRKVVSMKYKDRSHAEADELQRKYIIIREKY